MVIEHHAMTPAQITAARYLAAGYSQSATAKQLDLNLRTLQRWVADPEYDSYVTELMERAWERLEPGLHAMMANAVEVVNSAILGEVKAGDPRAKLAWAVVQNAMERLYPAEATPRSGTAIQFNIGSGPDEANR